MSERIREMKSYTHLFEKALCEAIRRAALKRVRRSKRMRRYLKKHNISDDMVIEMCEDWLLDYRPKKHKPRYRYDPIAKKTRKLIMPDLQDMMVGNCVCIAMGDVFRKGLYKHRYSSIRGRGGHKAKKVIEKWIRKRPGKVKFCGKCDIYHFYDEIIQALLWTKFTKYIRDRRMLELLGRLLGVIDRGLPVGYPTSPLFAAWLLQPVDHYIKETLRVPFYIGWADDMVLFDASKRRLHRDLEAVDKYLQDNLGLKLKGNWQVFRFAYYKNEYVPDSERPKRIDKGRDLDFMGYRFYRTRTTLRRAVMLRMTRSARKISKKPWPTVYDARRMSAAKGWLKSTNTHDMAKDWIYPYVNFRQMERTVSRKSKSEENYKYNALVKLYS